MKTFAINLPRDISRRKTIENALQSAPVVDDYEIVEAVDGRALTPDERRRLFDYDGYISHTVGQPTDGEVGCALSHHAVWERIAALGKPAMVVEDDLHFEGDWTDAATFAAEWLDSDRPRCLLLPRHFFYYRAKAHGNSRVARPIHAYGAECYMINPTGARLLCSLGRPHYLADDWDYLHSRGLDLRAIIPHPVVLNTDFSSNIGRRSTDRLPWRAAQGQVSGQPFTFGYARTLMRIILHKARILKKYLSATEI